LQGQQPAYGPLGGQQRQAKEGSNWKRRCIWLFLALILIAAVVIMGVKLSESTSRLMWIDMAYTAAVHEHVREQAAV
jgi:hypothetical protein